jgi:hypothetical protein
VGPNYEGFVQARALIRVARSIFNEDQEASWLLTQKAIELNPMVKPAWDHLIEHFKAESFDAKAGGKWMGKMVKSAHEHPDLLWSILNKYLNHLPKDDRKTRDRLYDTVFKVLGGRPDLQIMLRRWHCFELYESGDANRATSLAVHTLNENADEGALLLPLLKVVVKDAEARPDKQRRTIKKALHKMETTFPEKRGDTISVAWQEMKSLMEKL